MTAKHDAKRARENMWVTQQNLARAKGGGRPYQHQPKAPKPAPAKAPPSETAAPAPADVGEASSNES